MSKRITKGAVDRLARELYAVAIAAMKPPDNYHMWPTWKQVQPFVKACHRAAARYVLENFTRKEQK